MTKEYCKIDNNGGDENGGGTRFPLAQNQCSAAVRAPKTIRPSTMTVVNSEYFRSVLINFLRFNFHTKSEIAHFCTNKRKNLAGISVSDVLSLPLLLKIRQNSTLNLLAYRPLTPLLTSSVFFPAYRTPIHGYRVIEGKRLPYVLSGA
ncbi:Hypothetical protein AKI40_2860 [Enterobacter sp. FY-07]|nr:Hypothetical protein AKI40_2860 [Enterobacter sp. FY-07]